MSSPLWSTTVVWHLPHSTWMWVALRREFVAIVLERAIAATFQRHAVAQQSPCIEKMTETGITRATQPLRQLGAQWYSSARGARRRATSA